MSRNIETGISLAAHPTIHVGPILNPNTNETISIVIPLSAQLATVPDQRNEPPCIDCNEDNRPSTTNSAATSLRNDKTKGCPFPTCVRYGHAFSRAHDLKRHIARHEMRKDKLPDIERQRPAREVTGNTRNDTVLQKDRQCNAVAREDSRNSNTKSYSCFYCRKKYASESKLKTHILSHDKMLIKNVCAVCNACFQNEVELQEHMKHHTATILHMQGPIGKVGETSEKGAGSKDDDFPLEEMLLLNKKSKRPPSSKTNAKATSKIRCDYCSKTFKTKWTLSSHVAAHEGRFQFDCTQCGKKFVRKSHYEGHVRSHEAARPYICEQCGKTFKELKHRREHTKRKHSGNQNAIQNLLDSVSSPCPSEEISGDQTKFTLLMPVNFST